MLAYAVAPRGMQAAGLSVVADTLSASDTLAPADTLPASADSVLAVRRQLTVDSVLNSYTEDSIRAMLQANRVLEVQPDSSKMDTVRHDTTRQSKSALEQPVHYTAKDSITFDYGRSMANLYGESRVNYQNLELTADHISMAIDSSIVHATGRVDSTGVTKGAPVFKQGGDEYEPDKISYNFKSQKAFINNVYTEQGEGFLISEESKRDSMGVMYVKGGKYTTCDARHPHFYWVLTRAKVRPGKNAIFAPAYLVVEDVPLPLAIPYGFVPFSKKYSSGFIMPTYGDETRRGFYLRDGGYYFAINDNVDLKALGEIYTKGSWGLSAASVYRKRYKFSGNVYLSYQNTKDGEKN
ncbi:MAG: LPS-assembly protein LptD, partial [Bacteroidaceae bacterium]|nr:LPS-assembly protein LptD [Bacteroidaceae bacterium]